MDAGELQMLTADWFQVDRKGLAKLLEGRSKAFILHELIQNAWDTESRQVTVTTSLEKRGGQYVAIIIVEDEDPEGFVDLAHAYTLFAESAKKADVTKRGRFNLGEKLVLAIATEAYIHTTKGMILFDKKGRHNKLSRKREAGSEIWLQVPMTKGDYIEMMESAMQIIAPMGVQTVINGNQLPFRRSLIGWQAKLPTVIAGDDGVLRNTKRETTIYCHEVLPGEVPTIYEMGIPVVAIGDKWHVNIGQKVPLNMDRDNVPPSYLQTIRVEVLNHNFDCLRDEEFSEPWVREACGDERVGEKALKAAIAARHGSNAVIYDVSDPEANKISVAEGRQVVFGGSLTAGEWANVKAHNIIQPAGKVTPSPKPFSPDGKPLNLLDRSSEWTRGMEYVAQFAHAAAREILGHAIDIQITDDPGWPFNATYGGRQLIFNAGRLGRKFFENNVSEAVIDLVIHEFGHEYESDHLSRAYNDALTMVGAKMTRLALNKPELFDAWNH
jgi:hypothetical protein